MELPKAVGGFIGYVDTIPVVKIFCYQNLQMENARFEPNRAGRPNRLAFFIVFFEQCVNTY